MLRTVPLKLQIAAFTLLALIDLQLYAHRFHQPTAMLGQYLRHLIDARSVVRNDPAMSAHPLRDVGSTLR